MATYTHTMQLDTGGTLTFEKTLTDANAQRIIAAHRVILEAPPGATAAAVWTRIADAIFAEIKGATIAQETAAQQAAVVVPGIEAS